MRFRTVLDLFKRAIQRFIAMDTLTMGAALAYYTVFSLAPLVLIAVSIAGMVYGEQAAEGQLATELESAAGPAVANAIQEMVNNTRNTGGSTSASVIGVIILLFGASGVFVQLQSSLNAIWKVEPRKTTGVWAFISDRLHTFALVLGIGFLLLVSLVINTALSAMSKYIAPGQTLLAQILNQVVSFGFITLLFALIFKVLPDRKIGWDDVWIGAASTSLLFTVGKYLLGVYLARGSVTSAFGAAGSLVVILLWVYYASQLVLFGAQFTQVYTTYGEAAGQLPEAGHASPERTAADTGRKGEDTRRNVPST